MRSVISVVARQALYVAGAILIYFGVRGQTEGAVATADANAQRVLDAERAVGIDIEAGLQSQLVDHRWLVDLANWIYIWGHWPLILATLVWLVVAHRERFWEFRNAIFISGSIGLVIFATFPVTPPRLFSPEYLDTVTVHSEAYRVLQPPSLVNKYAAVPSLHFGWNLLLGITWYRVGRRRRWTVAAIVMPMAMGFAVVATANHWVLDVIAGAIVALAGLAIEEARHRRWVKRRAQDPPPSEDPHAITSTLATPQRSDQLRSET